jgi:hypothetical protein
MQQFKSMNELVEYLGSLEERLKSLESENTNLRALQPRSESVDGNVIARYVSRSLPQTNILSAGFLKRAFAVWGHFFVANLIIGVIVGVVYACLMMVLFGSMFGNMIQLPK